MNICVKCLYSTLHPLGLILDEEGICSGCRIHEEKYNLSWDDRWTKLEKLVEPYKGASQKNYDCIIPISGANDSYFTVYIAKEKLGLNPLLVYYNKYFNTPLGIKNLSNLRRKFNCDIIFQNVNPISVKKITKTTLRKFGSIYWPCIAGHTVFPVQTAVRYKIPLIIWGAHQGVEQVGMFSHEHEVEMTRVYRKNHDLMGYEAEDILSDFDILREQDVFQYVYPDDNQVNSVGVRGIYLSNYIMWDPKAHHEKMIDLYQYKTSNFERTFDCYDYTDCYNYMNIHDLLKLYKQGFSKVTDHATREIRHGRLTRKQAIMLVRKYEMAIPGHLDKFYEWLGVTPRGLNFVLDQHRNRKFWTQENNNWVFRGISTFFDKDDVFDVKKKIFFVNSDSLDSREKSKYVTFGKGFL